MSKGKTQVKNSQSRQKNRSDSNQNILSEIRYTRNKREKPNRVTPQNATEKPGEKNTTE